MARYRTFNVAFKRQVAQEFLTGESLNSLSRKYDIARNLIRIWVLKHEGGEFEPEFEHDNRLKAHEVKIAFRADWPLITSPPPPSMCAPLEQDPPRLKRP